MVALRSRASPGSNRCVAGGSCTQEKALSRYFSAGVVPTARGRDAGPKGGRSRGLRQLGKGQA